MKRKTLLEWLLAQPEASMQLLTGKNDVYSFMRELRLYGLQALEQLTADEQYFIINQYQYIFAPVN